MVWTGYIRETTEGRFDDAGLGGDFKFQVQILQIETDSWVIYDSGQKTLR